MLVLDDAMWEILRLIWSNVDRQHPTFYTAENLGQVQMEIIESLADGTCTTITENGTLQAVSTWYWLPGKSIEVTNASANPGYMRKLVKEMRVTIPTNGVMWHRTKQDRWMRFPNQRGAACGN